MGKGSGSVTAFSHADGFIPSTHTEIVEPDTRVEVQLLGQAWACRPRSIGSHCVGLDFLLGELLARG